ncbi:MAG: NADH-quinone oxidoreductase subunit NuoG [Actinobacteria bacterium]|nr:NADH-quinone oxidoreductase subunit NuoG [Actinomycetota bacterium]
MTSTETNVTSDENQPPVDPNAVTMSINGRSVVARKGELIIAAADRSGDYIPRFCYHPRMSPVGMCRQCLVEVEGPRGPMMVVSCMTPVADGQVVRTDTPQVKRAHEGILELLLANHPLDCPVCDKGGECPLQDQAFSHGPGESRFVEEKRHYEKPIPISDIVLLDRERCILCDRCTRFADEVAGDALIHFTSRGNNTQVLTFPDEPFSSYFSGNTVQICPVGALTAKPYRFKARPWDLEKVESTCTTCSVGCRITVESSRDELLRYQGVDSDPVNWSWLCDKGRFNFEAVASDARLEQPLIKRDGKFVETDWSSALRATAELVSSALRDGGAGSVAILGGARSTNEDAYAWSRLARALGTSNVDAQLGDGLPSTVYAYPQATIDEAANASTVIVLGPDLKEELPVLHLRLRDASEKKRSKIVEFGSKESGLTRYAWKHTGHEPGQQVAAVRSTLTETAVVSQLGKGSVVVVVGRGNLAESPEFTMSALAAVMELVPNAKVLPVLRRGNVRGALSAGLGSGSAVDILERAAAGKINCLVLVGADPLADFPDADLARRALTGVPNIVSLDTFMTTSSSQAQIVLPAAAFGEKDGTTTNLEGRVSQLSRKVTTRGTSRPDWMVAVELADLLDVDLGVGSVHDVFEQMVSTQSAFRPIDRAALKSSPDGVLLAHVGSAPIASPVPDVPERAGFSYRLVVSRKLYDAGQNVANSPSLALLAPGAAIYLHPLDLDRLGAPAGSNVKAIGARTSVVMRVEADATVHRGTAWVPFNQPGGKVGELIDASALVNDVRLENL